MFIRFLTAGYLIVSAASASALTVELSFNDQVFSNASGQLNYVALKQAVWNQRPDVKLVAFNLTRIVIVAKSQYGSGSARAKIGNILGAPVTVPGLPSNWRGQGENTFYSLDLPGPANSGFGGSSNLSASPNLNWQVTVVGNIKVRRVILELTPRAPSQTLVQTPPSSSAPAPAPTPAPVRMDQPQQCFFVTDCYMRPVTYACSGPTATCPLIEEQVCNTREVCY